MSDDLKFVGGLLLASYFVISLLLSAAAIRQREEILDLREKVQLEREAKESFKKSFEASLKLLSEEMKKNH